MGIKSKGPNLAGEKNTRFMNILEVFDLWCPVRVLWILLGLMSWGCPKRPKWKTILWVCSDYEAWNQCLDTLH